MKTQTLASMNRRMFLKRAGVGSIALGSLPILAETLAPRASADEETTMNFIFAAVSKGPTIGDVVHTLVMDGAGMITPSHAEGGGAFDHLNNAPSAPFPKPFIAQGTWKAKELVSFIPFGTYGLFTAGVLTMDVELVRELPSRLVVPATLEIVCNIPFVPIITGKPEGFSLRVGDLQFVPNVPAMGITLFPPAGGAQDRK
jgi:hypothetical protein